MGVPTHELPFRSTPGGNTRRQKFQLQTTPVRWHKSNTGVTSRLYVGVLFGFGLLGAAKWMRVLLHRTCFIHECAVS